MVERSEQKERTRRKLIETALVLSAEKGFASLSLREIARAAGITPAGFYRHFHDLEELGLVLIDEVGLGLRQLLREARRNLSGNDHAVRTSVETFMRYITENANLFRVLQGERQGASSAFRRALFAELDRFTEEVAEDIERNSQKRGTVLNDLALAAQAIVAVAFTAGGEALDLPRHRRVELGEQLIKKIKMILRGAKAPTDDSSTAKSRKKSR